MALTKTTTKGGAVATKSVRSVSGGRSTTVTKKGGAANANALAHAPVHAAVHSVTAGAPFAGAPLDMAGGKRRRAKKAAPKKKPATKKPAAKKYKK